MIQMRHHHCMDSSIEAELSRGVFWIRANTGENEEAILFPSPEQAQQIVEVAVQWLSDLRVERAKEKVANGLANNPVAVAATVNGVLHAIETQTAWKRAED